MSFIARDQKQTIVRGRGQWRRLRKEKHHDRSRTRLEYPARPCPGYGPALGAQEPLGDPPIPRGGRRSGSGSCGWLERPAGPGHHVPGVITAGSFYLESERVFWDVHDPEKAVVIQLKEERYAQLVIEGDDPYATAATIQKTLGEEHNTSEARS
jgi:hypothetical protein